MSILTMLGLGKTAPTVTGLTAIEWISTNNDARLEVTDAGDFPTPEGKVTALDPLAFFQEPTYTDTPTSGGKLVVFYDPDAERNSKMALVFSDALVAGGSDAGTCMVEAGMASLFTPATLTAQTAFAAKIASDSNLYDGYFDQFDDPTGAERKIVKLPDGTPVPYVHSGWGDGGYPVFTLTDTNGALCAIYVDFMGCDEEGEWLAPPGVQLT